MSEPTFDQALFSELFDWQPQAYVWLRPIWNESGEGVADFEYVFSNDAGLQYLKLSRAQLGHLRLSDTPSLTDEMRPKILAEHLRAFTDGETVTADMYNPIINRYARVFRVRFRGGVLTMMQDKSDERRAIQEISERTRQLEQSNADLEEFAYAASHDLQEPLRKITTFSDRLAHELAGTLSAGQEGLLQRLQSAAGRMKGLIEDLLAYSRVSTRQEAFSPVDLNEVLGEVLQDLDGAIQEAGADVQIGPLPKLEGDARQLQQLFQNLLGNAIKYRSEERKPVISVSGRLLPPGDEAPAAAGLPGDGWYLVEVRDNGIGFDMQYASKIFQVFQRLHGRAEYEGSGIGLAIVQKVAFRHGGAVRALSQPDEGATFQVLLPVEALKIQP
ncbi:MAG: hypothetical protein EOO12_06635 [Chitinophagaceae bacterium]|nr:MAG: hypothetical protein EOO12_06635 [Chitinophagaceae bacterium]